MPFKWQTIDDVPAPQAAEALVDLGPEFAAPYLDQMTAILLEDVEEAEEVDYGDFGVECWDKDELHALRVKAGPRVAFQTAFMIRRFCFFFFS